MEQLQPDPSLLELEASLCREMLCAMHGMRMLQVGVWGGESLLTQAAAPFVTCIDLNATGRGDLYAAPEALPVLSKSIQVVVLPHTLEYTVGVDGLLSEIHRVLSDDGQIVALSHNPYSLHALLRGGVSPSGTRGHGVAWMRARLQTRGFAVTNVWRYSHHWPRLSGHPKQDKQTRLRYAFRGLCSAYLVVARKRVIPMTLHRKPVRRPAPKPAALAREVVARRAVIGGEVVEYDPALSSDAGGIGLGEATVYGSRQSGRWVGGLPSEPGEESRKYYFQGQR